MEKWGFMAESEVFGHYRELWQQKYGVPCSIILSPLDFAKMGTHMRENGVTHTQMMQSLEGYFDTDDPLVLKRRHPLGLFLVQPTRYMPVSTEPERYQASCSHSPMCPNTLTCCRKQDLERFKAGLPAIGERRA
jgi:hypothetical protein